MSFEDFGMDRRAFLAGSGVALSALGVSGLAGCASSQEAEQTDTHVEPVASADEITEDFPIGFNEDAAPMAYKDADGNYTGFDIDLIKQVCRYVGWNLVYKPLDWSTKDEALNSGEVRCLLGGMSTEGRETDYSFTNVYMQDFHTTAVRQDSSAAVAADLAGKVVAVQDASSTYTMLTSKWRKKDLGDSLKEIKTVSTLSEALDLLANSEVDAVMGDDIMLRYHLDAANLSSTIKILDESIEASHYAFAFDLSESGPEYASRVEYELGNLYNDGTVLADICKKYEQYGITPERWTLKKS